MLSSFRATCFILALTISVLRAYPVQSQDTPPPAPGQVVRPWQPGDPEPKGPLQIVVIEGQDAVNIIKKKTAVSPVIEVRDGKNTPIAGAAVTFTAPEDGASVTFSNGERTISVITDGTGRATVEVLKPLNVGPFQLTVASTFRSLSASTTIPMTNALKADTATTGASKSGGLSPTTIGILVGVAAAAAIGIGVGLGHHGSTTSSTPTSTATIGAGSGGSVGPP